MHGDYDSGEDEEDNHTNSTATVVPSADALEDDFAYILPDTRESEEEEEEEELQTEDRDGKAARTASRTSEKKEVHQLDTTLPFTFGVPASYDDWLLLIQGRNLEQV